MPLSPNTRLGRYEILSPLGAGGMGDVYLAQDTGELDRTVALKFLPPEVGDDSKRLQRFIQEARTVSRLNHPNILTVYDFGQADGLRFIATEYVDGVTLRRYASERRLKLHDVLDIAMQVAAALSAAHEAGVVHRDVKPENVMVRRDHIVKVLDFGLAKPTEKTAAARPPSVDTEAGTRLLVNTEPGLVMGTVAYMSPEQSRGLPVDARTDIWSLGVVLYEMLAGHLPFQGKDIHRQIIAIQENDPLPLSQYVEGMPERLEEIVTKALAKDPEERYQTAKDLLIDVRRLKHKLEVDAEIDRTFSPDASGTTGGTRGSAARSGVSTAAQPAAHLTSSAEYILSEIRRHKGGVLVGSAVLTLALAGLGYGLYRMFGARASSPASATLKTVPFTSFPGRKEQPAFSPDGRQVAFTWDGERGDNVDIYVRLVGEGSPLRLTIDSHVDRSPTWSPDGRSIAFVRVSEEGRTLITVPALGGAERKLLTSPRLSAVDWSPDGKQLAVVDSSSPDGLSEIYLVSPDTGEKKRLMPTPAQFNGDRGAKFSPDGRWVAFTRSANFAVDDVYVAPATGGEPRRLTHDGHQLAGITWTSDGRDVIFSSNRGGSYGLWRISIDGGAPEPLPGAGENAFQPSVSGQGGRLAYVYDKADTNVWRAPGPKAAGKGGTPTRLIASTRGEGSPRYSPDGKRIAFASDRTGGTEVWVCDGEGQNQMQLTDFGGHAGSPRWSADGRWIGFDARPEGSSDVYVVGSEGGSPRRLTTEPSADIMPVWSKDGRWIYFGSDRAGDWQIWRMPAAGGTALQVTQKGGYGPLESDDQYIYYSRNSGVPSRQNNLPGVWRVPLDGGDEVRVFDKGAAGSVSVLAEGIAFFNPGSAPDPATISYYAFASGQATTLLSIDRSKSGGFAGRLSVSPDGQWVVYVQTDQVDNDIMLVENFR